MHTNEVEVRKILTAEREKRIRRAYDSAWKDWWNSPERSKYSRWGRLRANMVFACLTEHLIKGFSGDKGAQFHFKNETFRLILDDKLVVRFKKANGRGVGSNILTQAEFDFCKPEPATLGLFPPLQKIEVVYILNSLNTAIDNIVVQERDGVYKSWSYRIGNVQEAQVVRIPQRPAPDVSAEDMVKPRTDEQKKSDDKKE